MLSPLWGFSQAPASHLASQYFNTSHGLSNNQISQIVKDKSGFLWIGTVNGLNRFDGNSFTTFFHQPGDPKSLGHNYIYALYADSHNRIWVSYHGGIARYENETGHFINYKPSTKLSYLGSKFGQMAEDNKGNIWISNNHGLLVLDPVTGYITDLNWPAFIEKQRRETGLAFEQGIANVINGNANTIWIKANNLLANYDIGTATFRRCNSDVLFSADRGKAFFDDTLAKKLYLGSYENGLLTYDYLSGNTRAFHTPANDYRTTSFYDPIGSIQPFANNRLLFQSELMVGWFATSTQRFSPPLPVTSLGVPPSNITSMLATDTGHIWLGLENGLAHIYKPQILINQVETKFTKQGSFGNAIVTTGSEDIYSYNFGDGFPYRIQPSSGERFRLPLKTGGFIPGWLRSAFKDSKGRIWMSTDGAVYCRRSGMPFWQKVAFLAIPMGIVPLPKNFEEDTNGRIWLLVRNAGLYVYNEANEVFMKDETLPTDSSAIFTSMCYDGKSNIFYLTEAEKGLHAIDPQPGRQRHLHHILSDSITSFLPEHVAVAENRLWMTDGYNGVLRFDPATSSKRFYSVSDGLQSNACQGVVSDIGGNIWVYSTEGIDKLDAATGSIVNMSGPELGRIQQISAGPDGRIYVATPLGIYWVDAQSVRPLPLRPKLYWKSILVMNQPYQLKAGQQLTYRQNDISLAIGGLLLEHAQPGIYQYRWKNDSLWQEVGLQAVLSFSRLPPAKYDLKVRIKDDTDPKNWLQMAWEIKPPIWQTLWFRVLALLILAAAIYLLYRRRMRQIQKQSELEQLKTEAEMKALRAQMNPHFIFNTLNSINHFIQKNDSEQASDYLTQFSRLMRQALDNSEKRTISLAKELETLQLYLELEQQRVKHKFKFEILANQVDVESLMVPPLILQPYAENAIWHGLIHTRPDGKLLIVLRQDGQKLFIGVTDNGIGRTAAMAQTTRHTKGKSYGSHFTKSRILMAHPKNTVELRDLLDERGEAAGTEVLISLNMPNES